MNKRLVLALLSIIMIFSLLSACSGNNNKAEVEQPAAKVDEPKKEEPKAEAPKEVAAEPVTIKFHHWYDDAIEKFDVVIAEFNKAYPNIKVESVSVSTNDANGAMKQIDLAAASGEDLDVIIVNSPSNYAQRVAIGLLEPLDDLMQKDGFKYDDEFSLNTAVDGKIYAFPGKLNEFFVLLNKNHLDEAKLPVPTDWTWDDYMDYAQKLTKGEGANKRYGTYFHTWLDYIKLPVFNQMENSNLVKDDGVTSNMDNPLFRKALEIRERGIKDGSATPYADTITQKLHYRQQFYDEKVSMEMIGSWMIGEGGGSGPIEPKFQTVYAPYPKANIGDPSTTPVGADFISVAASSKHKEAAYTFAKWFATEGLLVQSKYLTSWKNADVSKLIDGLVSTTPKPELIDKPSLLHTLTSMTPQKLNIPVAYQAEVEKAYQTEAEKFLLGDQDMDTTLNNAQKAVQALIDANK
ncbi:MAG: extracellular solute-binding protein [Paenibacillaceae bacterium]